MSNTNPKGICHRCGTTIGYTDKFCSHCGARNEYWRVPDKNQCGNCHASLQPDDQYCRICGTRAGEGAYAPYQEMMQCIYGPLPESRTHVCEQCGYTWTTCLMIDNQRYCPKCGGHAPCSESSMNGGIGQWVDFTNPSDISDEPTDQ